MRHSLRPATSTALLLLLLPLIDCGRWEQTGSPSPPLISQWQCGQAVRGRGGVSWPVANAASLKNVGEKRLQRLGAASRARRREAREEEGELSSSAFD